jgi:hypothetical protein
MMGAIREAFNILGSLFLFSGYEIFQFVETGRGDESIWDMLEIRNSDLSSPFDYVIWREIREIIANATT